MRPLLTHTQLSKPRTPVALLEWVERKSKAFGASQKAKAYARSRTQLPKKFWEEIRPLAHFAVRRFGHRSDVRITPNLGNENFDATISVPGQEPRFVEVTYAKDGYDEALRLEVLARDGSVNALAPITTFRRKGAKRHVSVANEAVNHAEVLQRHLSLVKKRLEKKASGSYGLGHTLLLVVDDYIPFRTSPDVEALEDMIRSNVSRLCLDFRELVILGASGQLFLPYTLSLDLSVRSRSNKGLQGTRQKRRAPEARR